MKRAREKKGAHQMYAAVRQYHGAGEASKIKDAVQKELVPVLKQNPGFRGFYMLDCGGNTIVSISVFDSEDAARQSNQQAVAARAKFHALLPNDPEIMVGETMIAETA